MAKADSNDSPQSSTQVAREVARLILTGVWREGTTLPREIELASRFDVSRASIREALSLLKAKGLIVSKQKAGTHVRARIDWNMLDEELLNWTLSELPTQEFAKQLLEIRRIVEPEACAICAARGTDEDFARIERAYRGMDAAGMDRLAYAEPDLQFHRGILIATGNDFLIAFGATVAAALRMSFNLSTQNAGAPRKSLPYHRAVLDAIWARNPDAARQAMHKLMDLTEQNIISALSRQRKKDAEDENARTRRAR
ncbi:GntR family transcriptional regulator [Bradyrhizobium centrolobii]|uniref:GntR family transcriptional regulator n=1 Tax=Bradyrhizobium centrolobii TaxID=1505087 RepID=A0A176YH38_9BRAD|nr:FadR/GntR family transcriptional regulator [Bradyrhizobium centrolobii]OAF05224.1 GntR family transcriptional regulator [Bradyrhizobium centrolobii]